MTDANPIPAGPHELTPEALTSMLRESGVLREANVTAFDTEILGEGQGFLGVIARMCLELDRPEDGAPASLIGKFPTLVEQNRGMAETLGFYEREIRFYRDLAHTVSIRKPRHYYSELDFNPALEKTERTERVLNRVPGWVARRLVPLMARLAGRSKRRYMLLMEDLSPARPGDQVTGCRRDVAEVIVRNLAVMHASWWESPKLDELKWITKINFAAPFMHRFLVRGMPEFLETFGEKFPVLNALTPWLREHGVELANRLAEPPRTFLHGDYRLDNMCLTGDGGDVEVTVFDWQTIVFGRGAFDLAYFLGGNIPVGEVVGAEPNLVRAYHQALVDAGVRDYDFDRCFADYEMAKLFMLYRMMAAHTELIDLGEARGKLLVDAWMERLIAVVPQDWERLLS